MLAKRRGLEQLFLLVQPDPDEDGSVDHVHILYRLEPGFGLPDELASLERSAAAPTHDPEEAERKRRQAIAEAEALRRRLLNPKGPIL